MIKSVLSTSKPNNYEIPYIINYVDMHVSSPRGYISGSGN